MQRAQDTGPVIVGDGFVGNRSCCTRRGFSRRKHWNQALRLGQKRVGISRFH